MIAKDTPNFIANRIGTFSMLNAFLQMTALEMTIEEVDACTGPAVGWPKSATFRTADIVGLDVLVHVIRNIYDTIPDDESREMFQVPPLVEEMMKRGWLGEKTGGGFYKRVKGAGGESEILTLDWQKMEYRAQQKARFASIEAGKAIEDTRGALAGRLLGPRWKERPATRPTSFLGRPSAKCASMRRGAFRKSRTRSSTWTARCNGASAGKSGRSKYGMPSASSAWRRRSSAKGLYPPIVAKVLASPAKSFYQTEKGSTRYFDWRRAQLAPVPEPAGILILKSLKDRTPVVQNKTQLNEADVHYQIALHDRSTILERLED